MKTLRLPFGAGGVGVGLGCAIGAVCLILGVAQAVQAQATKEIDVTFYDFHSDRSNPEFEQPHVGGLKKDMVQDTLDRDEKPVAKLGSATDNAMNRGIRFWFRDWSKLNAGTYAMASVTEGGHGYLEKFRPIYMYANKNSSDFNLKPPEIQQKFTNVGNYNDYTGEFQRPFRYVGNAYKDTTINGYKYSVDTAYTNRVIKGTLTFNRVGTSRIYEFSTNAFFPLSHPKGVGGDQLLWNPERTEKNEAYNVAGFSAPAGFAPVSGVYWNSGDNDTRNTNHKAKNFSFTMEMKTSFQYKRDDNLVFNFRGDDDVWLFIGPEDGSKPKRLVKSVDIGGIHEKENGSVVLNNIATDFGLVDNKAYDMHLFYCERHSDQSNIWIQTNIIANQITNINLKVTGGDMKAGDDKKVSATVETDTGVLKTTPGTFTWEVRDSLKYNTTTGNAPELTVKSATSNVLNRTNEVNINAQKAYTWVVLHACYQEPDLEQKCKDTTLWVGPGDPDKVWIEASSDSIFSGSNSNLREARPIGTINIGNDAEYVESFYAILRDKYGNWVSRAGTGSAARWQGRTMTWPTTDAKIATAIVAPGNTAAGVEKSSLGQGRAIRVATEDGRTWVKTVYGGTTFTLKTDSAEIVVGKINYTDIRIVGKNGQEFPKGKIEMTVGADTTLYAELYDPVNKKWVEMPVTWTVANVPGVASPTGTARDMNVKPTGETPAAGGKVTAGYNGLEAFVQIVAVNKDPASTGIFSKRGEPDFSKTIKSYLLPAGLPSTPQPYVAAPEFVTVTAGATLPLVSSLFTDAPPSAASYIEGSGQLPKDRWVWSFVQGSPTNAEVSGGSALSALTGDSVAFRSTVAHQQYRVKVVYTDTTGGKKISVEREIVIAVVPDIREPKVYIENQWERTAVNANAPQKVDTLSFAKNDTLKSVYAILRDQYGNYIAPSGAIIPAEYGVPPGPPEKTGWGPAETAKKVVYAVNGQLSSGQGLVKTTGEDGAGVYVVATDNTFTVNGKHPQDSVFVRLLKYYYEEIKIVKPCNGGTQLAAGYCEVKDINMSTDETETLYVVGKCSDGTCDGANNTGWELVTADWDRDGGLMSALTTPPKDSRSWTLNPNTTGKGNVSVTRPGPEGSTLTATIPVNINAGVPTMVELTIITPPNERIAGKGIIFELTYRNSTGELMEWNEDWGNKGAYFADILQGLAMPGQKEPAIASIGGGWQELYYVGQLGGANSTNASLSHDLASGKDRVTIYIYNATDNPHQIKYREVVESVTLETVSEKFTVLPGAPVAIRIEGDNVKDGKLDVKQSDKEQVLRVVAVDEYGNRIGDYSSNWNTPTDKPIPVHTGDRPIIVYVPGNAEDNGCGLLVVVGVANPALKDSIEVCVSGVTARPISAITRDYDGCGYLDRIELKFKKPIAFVGGDTKASVKPGADKISLSYNNSSKDLAIDSVTVNTGDSTVVIWLHDEAPHNGSPQTGWTPTITIMEGFFVDVSENRNDPVLDQKVSTTDGAPPVISKAELFFEKTGNAADNYIKVTFSERIEGADGMPLGIDKGKPTTKALPPDLLFNIWSPGGLSKAKLARTRALSKKAGDSNTDRQLTLQADRLEGIKQTIWVDDYTLRFQLENGREITPPNDYINIRTKDQAERPVEQTQIRDVPDNVPLANNRKVPITFGNEPGGNMKPIPNPASPDPNRVRDDGGKVGAGTIYATHDEGAIRDIKTGAAGGTVFEVPIYVPNEGKVRCRLKVYDLAGNLVIANESDNAALAGKSNAMEVGYNKMHLYWNGYNAKGMKVAPGTYRMVVYISYSDLGKNDVNAKNKKYQGIVGMSK